MYTPATIFLCVIVLCVGMALGAIIERVIKKPTPRSIPLPQKDKLASEDDVEVFSAWRRRDNQVWLDMDGRRLDKKEDLTPENHQRLLSLVLDLRPWLDAARSAPTGPAAVPPPVQPPASGPQNSPQPVQERNNEIAPVVEEINPSPKLDSIIKQIDKVLQAMLANSVFKDRGIRLIEGPGGIVIIQDGENQYEGVEAIPDPQVKALVRQAVDEWEKGTR